MSIAKQILLWFPFRNWLLRVVGNHVIKALGYGKAGKMTHLKIDQEHKTIDIQLELQGENTPVTLHLAQYSFEELPDGAGRLSIRELKVSKPWMETIAKNAIGDKPIDIPRDISKWLKMVL